MNIKNSIYTIIYIIFILIKLSQCATQEEFETYWISPIRGIESTGCGLLKEFPCKTIGDIIPNRITPNVSTIINLLEGVYRGNFSYLLTNYIILFKGVGRDKTIIDLEWRQRFAICTISDFHFKDLTIKNGFAQSISNIYDGGAIYAYDSQVHFINVALIDNTCIATGGGIYLYNCYFNAENSLFKNNTAASGGAVILLLSASNITNSIFIENKVVNQGKGGAIQVFISFMKIELSLFAYNIAPYSGAIDMVGGNLTSIHSIFIENHSNIGGGFGLYFISNVAFESCQFINNRANSTGGLAFLTAQSMLRFSLCIFKGNYAPNCGIVESHSISPLLFESCSFTGDVPTAVQIALYDNYCFLMVQNCHFHNIQGVLMYADSISNIIIDSSTFTNVTNRIIDVGNEADILIISSTFYNIRIDEYLVSLSNGNFLAYNMDFRNNTVLALIKSSVGGSVTMVSSSMKYNIVSTGLISLKNGYSIYIENCEVLNNTGLFKGCFIDADHTGAETVTQSLFENNRSPFGPILYFSDPEIEISTSYPSAFSDIVFINNFAYFSGALVYFSQNVTLPNITCTNCIYINNTAVFGELVNSAFYNFNVSIPPVIYPFQDLTIEIFALDFFGNLVRGTSDLGFFAIPCSDAFVEGNLFAVLSENGSAIFTNIKLSSNPNSICNLTFLSVPIVSEGGPITIPISFTACPSDRELVLIKSIYYCLKTVKVSDFVKLLVGALAVILLIILIFSGFISLKYRKKRVIRYSNPLFLSIILIGCIIYLIVIPILFSSSETSCKVRFPIIVIGSCLITCSVFIKQFRIWRLIKDIQLLRETNVENKYLLKFISILMVIPIILVACSFFLFPTHEKYTFNQNDVTITHYCSDGMYLSYIVIFLVYQMAILLFGCYLVIVCRKFRSIPGTFNEATYIGILIYNYTVVLIVAIPLAYVFNKNPLANFLILSISTLVFVLSTIILLFIPKFHFLLRKKAIISSLEKLIKEQEVIVQRNKDILYFYDMYLADERPGHQIGNMHTGGVGGGGNRFGISNLNRRRSSNLNNLNMTGFSDSSSNVTAVNPNLTSFTTPTSEISNISNITGNNDSNNNNNNLSPFPLSAADLNKRMNNNNKKKKSSTPTPTQTTPTQTTPTQITPIQSTPNSNTRVYSNKSSPNMIIPPTNNNNNVSSPKSSTIKSPLTNKSRKSSISSLNSLATSSSNTDQSPNHYNEKVINRIFNIHPTDKNNQPLQPQNEDKSIESSSSNSSSDDSDPDFNKNINNKKEPPTSSRDNLKNRPLSKQLHKKKQNDSNNDIALSPINLSNNDKTPTLPPLSPINLSKKEKK